MKLNLKTCGYGITALALLLGRYPISWLLSNRHAKKLRPKSSPTNPGTQILSSTGNVLFVKSEGRIDATPLVFIHGINSNGEQWQYQQQYFKDSYRLILIDLPGHGRSPDAKDLSVKALAIDLSTVLTKLDIKQPVLYGHSLGGMMIQEYCKLKLSPAPAAIILQSCSHTNPLKTMPISPLPLAIAMAADHPDTSKYCPEQQIIYRPWLRSLQLGIECRILQDGAFYRRTKCS